METKGEMLDDVTDISKSLFPYDDDLVQKANGWLLRESGKADLARLESFLLRHGKGIPRTTLRHAIERFEEKKRKKLLGKTRAETRKK
jgi:3-methyladenine DNA glycosylase AlkD